MVQFLLDLIQFNNQVPDYSIIIPVVIIYLCSLWLIVSIWTFFDARKRYSRKSMAFLVAILNFILQFPFLFVYLLIRPSGADESEEWIDGGVNVPVVNFTGSDGIVMSLELRINPKKVADARTPEMKIDVSFDSDDQQKQLINIEEKQTGTDEKTIVVKRSGGIVKKLSGIKSKLFTRKPKPAKEEAKKEESQPEEKAEQPVQQPEEHGSAAADSAEDTADDENDTEDGDESDTTDESDPGKGKKKHKKKRRRR